MKEQILSEIRRLAESGGGVPPGRSAFARQTGIADSIWAGRIWARWGDAVTEAGFTPNERKARVSEGEVLENVASACRHFGRLPTAQELKLYRRQQEASFPSYDVIQARFGSMVELTARLSEWAGARADMADITTMLPVASERTVPLTGQREGLVYLLRSGPHFKIGRSDEVERRVKQISVALPEAVDLIHAIRTDDPPGIEAYWHRRFADRRANGEWFKLSPNDVAAFKRRKFQ
ncbi:GIY-YIG nuclease family protein [Brevundimonas sp. BR2-1]|uniref:GIY-YIG nuclease family protein n=1 Tax=Brevundimonas sp. BR2-1 TaxID=3031123 RepID=UPI00309D5D31